MTDSQFRINFQSKEHNLRPIVDTVKLCGPLNKYHPDVGEYGNVGVGNFVELLNFRVRAGNVVLKNHMESC